MAAIKYDQRNKSDDAYDLENFLKTVLVSDHVIDLSQLCVVKGKLAFRLEVHISVLCNRGNLRDAILLAAVTALQDTTLPEPDLSRADIVFTCESSRALQLKALPISITVAWFENCWLVDPSDLEEAAVQSHSTYSTNTPSSGAALITCVFCRQSQSLLHMQQNASSVGISAERMMEAIGVCQLASSRLTQQLLVSS